MFFNVLTKCFLEFQENSSETSNDVVSSDNGDSSSAEEENISTESGVGTDSEATMSL